MKSYDDTKIRQYENFIRERINIVVRRIDFDKLDKKGISFSEETKNKFCFNNTNGWQSLTSCLDVVGDSQLAVMDFMNYRKSNKNNNYLMIYGILSAIYIQQQALIKLFELFHLEKIKSEFDCLIITFLRHCISAHPVNYNFNNKQACFKLVRHSLSIDGNLTVVNECNEFRTYNIYNAIEE